MNAQNELMLVSGRATWESGASLSDGFRQAYQSAFPNLQQSQFGDDLSKVKRRLVVLDHEPHPSELFDGRTTNESSEVVIHVFSDLYENSRRWHRVQKSMSGRLIRFICPSEKAAKLFGRFLLAPDASISVCSGAIDSRYFFFDQRERENTRSRLGIGDQDRVAIYVGRISLQKNVDLLVRIFAKLAEKSLNGERYHLWIVGEFDDVGSEMLGLPSLLGYSFKKIENTLLALPKSIRSSVHFQGRKNRDEIRTLLNAADLFCSLSVFHDEDFGLSAAEALSCGLPLVLTDWGGYSDFGRFRRDVDLIRVRAIDGGTAIDCEQAMNAIGRRFFDRETSDLRLRRVQRVGKKYSVEACARTLQSIHRQPIAPFAGFHRRLEEIAQASPEALWPTTRGLYRRLYRPFYDETRI